MRIFTLLFASLISIHAGAMEDPTKGKPFLPWLWREQFRPTIVNAISKEQLAILGVGLASTAAAHQYDSPVRENFGSSQGLGERARIGSVLGSGAPGIGIALIQLAFDQKNGLAHGRALALTSMTAFSTALIVQRDRPNHVNRLSYPSGHTSSSFATATSLAYAYGPLVGVPAFALASFVGASRISDDAHWLSDTVLGATLGIFWARASRLVFEESPSTRWMPVLMDGGVLLVYKRGF